MKKRATKKKPSTKRRRKNAGPDSWRKTVKQIKKARRAGRKKAKAEWDFPSRMKQVWKATGRKPGGAAARDRKGNPSPKKAKTGRWYKGPRGVKVRVRRVRGKFVVDLKK